jgi:hypothetical protein
VSIKSGISGSILSGIFIQQFNNTAMKLLKTEFRKNGLDYTLIKRTDKIDLLN